MVEKVEILSRICKLPECKKAFPVTRKDRRFCKPKHAVKYSVRKMRALNKIEREKQTKKDAKEELKRLRIQDGY